MKYHVGFFTVILTVSSAFAQDVEDSVLRELGMFGVYSLGNLALNDVQRGNDPVQQMKRFFTPEKLPLTSAEEKQLNVIVAGQVKALLAAGENEDAVRRVNADYTKRVN